MEQIMKLKLLPIILCSLFAVACSHTPSQSGSKYTSISVKTNPEKLTYNESDFFDPTGLVISAYTSNQMVEDVYYDTRSEEFAFTPSLTTPLTVDITYVTVAYKKLTARINIAVIDEEAETFTMNIDFSTAPKTNSGNDGSFVQKICSIFENNGNEVTAFNYDGFVQINENTQTTISSTYVETVLMLGKSSGGGTLNYSFTYKLISIELVVRAHMKLYVQQGSQMISSDNKSKLNVNGVSWSLPTPTIDNHETQTRSFVINSNDLSLSSNNVENGRVWIFSASLTFATL